MNKYIPTPITIILIVACVLLYIPEAMGMGINDYLAVDSDSAWIQPWTFITAMFAHGSLEHLACNMVSLWYMGSLLERMQGSLKFSLVYFISGIAGNVAFVQFGVGSAVGASGAIFGLLGALVVLFYKLRGSDEASSILKGLASMLAINVLNSFMPGIALEAHFGGLGAGIAMEAAIIVRALQTAPALETLEAEAFAYPTPVGATAEPAAPAVPTAVVDAPAANAPAPASIGWSVSTADADSGDWHSVATTTDAATGAYPRDIGWSVTDADSTTPTYSAPAPDPAAPASPYAPAQPNQPTTPEGATTYDQEPMEQPAALEMVPEPVTPPTREVLEARRLLDALEEPEAKERKSLLYAAVLTVVLAAVGLIPAGATAAIDASLPTRTIGSETAIKVDVDAASQWAGDQVWGCIQVPNDWTVSQIGKDHFMLESPDSENSSEGSITLRIDGHFDNYLEEAKKSESKYIELELNGNKAVRIDDPEDKRVQYYVDRSVVTDNPDGAYSSITFQYGTDDDLKAIEDYMSTYVAGDWNEKEQDFEFAPLKPRKDLGGTNSIWAGTDKTGYLVLPSGWMPNYYHDSTGPCYAMGSNADGVEMQIWNDSLRWVELRNVMRSVYDEEQSAEHIVVNGIEGERSVYYATDNGQGEYEVLYYLYTKSDYDESSTCIWFWLSNADDIAMCDDIVATYAPSKYPE